MNNNELVYKVDQVKEANGASWKCTIASVDQDIHYYEFTYIKKNGKLGRSTWVMVGKRYDLRHKHYGR